MFLYQKSLFLGSGSLIKVLMNIFSLFVPSNHMPNCHVTEIFFSFKGLAGQKCKQNLKINAGDVLDYKLAHVKIYLYMYV